MQISEAPQLGAAVITLDTPAERFTVNGQLVQVITVHSGTPATFTFQTADGTTTGRTYTATQITPLLIPSASVRATLARALKQHGTPPPPEPTMNEILNHSQTADGAVLDFNTALQRAVLQGRRHR